MACGLPRAAIPEDAVAFEWECAFPKAADRAKEDEAVVDLQIVVTPDGRPRDIMILTDPGYGFGRAARLCAARQKYIPAHSARGEPVEGTIKVRVHYVRPSTVGE
ncbi:MAG TPA: energy transducer TonB [Polyangiaceae bacterium]